MCEEVVEVVESVQPGRVFVVEEDGIWFSGMNQDLGSLVREVAEALEEAGWETGEPQVDDAVEFNGMFLPVEGCSAVDDDTHYALVSSPGGDREVETTPEP